MPFSIAVGTLPDERLQLFAYGSNSEGTGGQLWSTWKRTADPNADWTDWTPFLPPNPRGFPLGSIRAVNSLPNGALQVFAENLREKRVGIATSRKRSGDPDADWTEWQEFYTPPPATGVNGFAVGPLSDGRLQAVIAPDFSPLLTTWMRTPDADSWSEVVPFEPRLPHDSTDIAGLTLAPIFFGRLQLWFTTPNVFSPLAGFWTTWKETGDSGSPWVGWSRFSSPAAENSIVRWLAAGSLSDGRQQLWTVTPRPETPNSEQLYSRWQTTISTDAPWSDWQPFSFPTFFKFNEFARPVFAAARLRDRRLQIWGVAGDGRLFSAWKETRKSNSHWSQWSPFPNPPAPL
jgi:hypothetical protein